MRNKMLQFFVWVILSTSAFGDCLIDAYDMYARLDQFESLPTTNGYYIGRIDYSHERIYQRGALCSATCLTLPSFMYVICYWKMTDWKDTLTVLTPPVVADPNR